MTSSEEKNTKAIADISDTEETELDIGKKIDILRSRLKSLSDVPEVYDRVAIKSYLSCSNAYKMLQNSLELPTVAELRKIVSCSSMSTDFKNYSSENSVFATALHHRAEIMNEEQKYCVLCVATTHAKKNLYYDIKRDKLIGVHVIEEQKPELAHKAVVMSLQGLFSDWKQLIGIGYLGSTDADIANTQKWVMKNITNLTNMGYDIKAVVRDIEDTTFNNWKEPVNVFILNDVNSMVKQFFTTWFTHNFIFNDKVAKIQHLHEYYELDRKLIVRLSPNLTEKVLKPESKEELAMTDILEVFSVQTAAAMTAYVTQGALPPAARSTILFITAMSELLKAMYKTDHSNMSQIEIFKLVDELLAFFGILQVVTPNGQILRGKSTLVPVFCSNIVNFFKLRFKSDMKDYKGDSGKIFQRLSLQNLESFFKRLKKDDSLPTCKKIHYSVIGTSVNSILKGIQGNKTKELNVFLDEMGAILEEKFRPNKHRRHIIPIKTTDYKALCLKRDDAIVLVSGYLQKRCFDHHEGCVVFNNYSHVVSQPLDSISLYKTILKEIQEDICMMPQENFIDLVEIMEIKFRSFMTKNTLKTQNGFVDGLLTAMDPIGFKMPCKCFPLYYAKILYLRLRVFNLLKFNNRLLVEFPYKHNIVVNDLFE